MAGLKMEEIAKLMGGKFGDLAHERDNWKALAQELATPLREILQQGIYVDGEFACCIGCGAENIDAYHDDPRLWKNGWHLGIPEKENEHKKGCPIKKAIEALKDLERMRRE